MLARTGRGLLTLLFVVTLVFFATRATGDPTDWLLPDSASEQARESMRAHLGLDRPVHEQFFIYVANAVRGDLGVSFFERRPVAVVFAERLPYTMQLMGISLAVALFVGILVGVIAAANRNGWLDRGLMTLTFIAYSVPDFVMGIGLILLFSLQLGWLPSSGRGTWQHLVMPVMTLGLSSAALIARLTRSAMLDVLGQDYIRTARAKGLNERIVLLRHSLRNSLIPVISVVASMLAGLVGGAVVVETVFAWPGAGRLIVSAVMNRDFPVLQYSVLIVAAVVAAASILLDLCYALIDPRVRLNG